MAFPEDLLARDEQVVIHKHPHFRVLVIPTLVFLVIIAAASFMAAWIEEWDDAGFTTHRWWLVATGAIAAILLIIFCLVPLVTWKSEHFVLTTRHVFFRTGVIHRRQHQIPLFRVQNVETVTTFAGRIFRYGTLIVDSSAEEPLEFSNVASLTSLQRALNQLVSDDRARHPESVADAAYPPSSPDDTARDEPDPEGRGG